MANAPDQMNKAVHPQRDILGPEVAPTVTDVPWFPSVLPPGVHPNDPSVPLEQLLEGDNPVPLDAPGDDVPTGRPAWGTDPYQAVPVYQRASAEWDCGVVKPNASTNGGTATIVGRQPGRSVVKIWVPTILPDGTTPLGVLIGQSESSLQGPVDAGVALNPGDSCTIETEASVFCAVLPGNQTGGCQWMSLSNPPGGQLGAQ